MDENSLETMLEAFDNLPDLVFNNLDEAEPATTKAPYLVVVWSTLAGSLGDYVSMTKLMTLYWYACVALLLSM